MVSGLNHNKGLGSGIAWRKKRRRKKEKQYLCGVIPTPLSQGNRYLRVQAKAQELEKKEFDSCRRRKTNQNFINFYYPCRGH